MKQIISYMANDGTIFDKYDDCAAYEKAENAKAAQGQLRFYDYDGELIADHTITDEEASACLDNCYYLFLGNDAAIKIADNIGYLASCSTPKETGYWYYDSKEDIWTSFSKRIAELENELNTLEDILKNLEV